MRRSAYPACARFSAYRTRPFYRTTCGTSAPRPCSVDPNVADAKRSRLVELPSCPVGTLMWIDVLARTSSVAWFASARPRPTSPLEKLGERDLLEPGEPNLRHVRDLDGHRCTLAVTHARRIARK